MKPYKTAFPVQFLCLSFLLVSIFLPLAAVFLNLDPGDMGSFIRSAEFLRAALNTLTAGALATFLSVSVAFVLAHSVASLKSGTQKIFCALLTLPMLLPSISHGMGLVITLGKNGLLSRLLHTEINIYGLPGIVLGSVMYSFPLAFLMLYDVMRYEDERVYEAADILGIGKANQFLSITLPYLKKPLISVLFATFSVIVTDYGVPMVVGGKYTTLSTLMYQKVIGLLDFSKGSLLGVCLLIPAVLAFGADCLKGESGGSYVVYKRDKKLSPGRRMTCRILLAAGLFFVLFPIGAFILLSFVRKYPVDMRFSMDSVRRVLDRKGLSYLGNSLLVSFAASTAGTLLAYGAAYFTTRQKTALSRPLHLLSMSPLSVPGLVLGIGYMLFFKKTPLYGTLGILILVNMTHFFGSPYLMACNSFHKMNPNLEDVGLTLGIGRLKMLWDVFVPQTVGTIAEMFSYFFVNSMITISAVSFLMTVDSMPVALLIPQFESQMLIECSAFVSLLILCINLIFKGGLHALRQAGKHAGKSRTREPAVR